MNVRVEAGIATTTRKLYSRAGTVLGTVTYPAELDLYIRKQRGVRVRFAAAMPGFYDPAVHISPTVRTFELFLHSGNHAEKEGLQLQGITLEEFERQPGCSFAPSAAYLRSVVE